MCLSLLVLNREFEFHLGRHHWGQKDEPQKDFALHDFVISDPNPNPNPSDFMDLNFELYNDRSFEWALTGWVESRKAKSSLSDAAPLASTLSSLKRL